MDYFKITKERCKKCTGTGLIKNKINNEENNYIQCENNTYRKYNKDYSEFGLFQLCIKCNGTGEIIDYK
jgi:DnaJ-class molecular chaperone